MKREKEGTKEREETYLLSYLLNGAESFLRS
jgi:hypothetical protein